MPAGLLLSPAAAGVQEQFDTSRDGLQQVVEVVGDPRPLSQGRSAGGQPGQATWSQTGWHQQKGTSSFRQAGIPWWMVG